MQSKPYNVHRLHEWSSPFVPQSWRIRSCILFAAAASLRDASSCRLLKLGNCLSLSLSFPAELPLEALDCFLFVFE
ncbi:hypothetical protein HanPSC8_Chr01g0033791 [Helianthus annuus]|nr:hypothetical protein HanPSC8_Chr01g0033791 [Helianthus annuus]